MNGNRINFSKFMEEIKRGFLETREVEQSRLPFDSSFPYNLATDYIVGATDGLETIAPDIQTPMRLRLQETREAESSI